MCIERLLNGDTLIKQIKLQIQIQHFNERKTDDRPEAKLQPSFQLQK